MDQIAPLMAEHSPWYTEAETVKDVLASSHLGEMRAFDRSSETVFLRIDRSGRVYLAGGCHGDPFRYSPEEDMLLGAFTENNSFEYFLNRFRENPPPEALALEGVTWAELAERYGDPRSDLVYNTRDLVVNRWGSMYLRDVLKG